MSQSLIHVEEIFEDLDGFGLYQRCVYALICLMSLTYSFQIGSTIFEFIIPLHRCRLPETIWPNDTFHPVNITHERLIAKYIPPHDQCQIYYEINSTRKLSQCINGSVYLQEQYKETYIATMNLVCGEQKWIVLLTQSLLLGNMIGSVIGGRLSDRKGRTLCIKIGIALQIIGGLLSGLETDKYARLIAKFAIGVSIAFTFNPGFVLSMELVSTKYRFHVGTIIAYVYAMGGILLAILGYFISNWKILQITITTPSFCLLACYWFMPESPRWLFSMGRQDEAYSILGNMAKCNKRRLQPRHNPTWWTDRMSSTISQAEEQEPFRGFCSSIIKSNSLLKRTLIISYEWFAVSLLYYVILFCTSYIPDRQIYYSYGLFSFAEILGYLTTHVTINRVGRVKPFITFMMISGIFCLLTATLTLEVVSVFSLTFVVLVCIIKFASSGAFALLYIWTVELFSTTHRNAGMGITSTVGQGGMLLAALLAQMLSWVMRYRFLFVLTLVLGVCSLLGGILAINLPETLDRPLPQTMAEEEELNDSIREERSPILTDLSADQETFA